MHILSLTLAKFSKPSCSLILLQDLMFPFIEQSLGLCQKNYKKKKIDFFSIKIYLLNHGKFDKMQEDSSEEAKKELRH